MNIYDNKNNTSGNLNNYFGNKSNPQGNVRNRVNKKVDEKIVEEEKQMTKKARK